MMQVETQDTALPVEDLIRHEEPSAVQDTNHLHILDLERKICRMQLEIEDLYIRNEIKDRGKRFEGSLTRVIILMVITYCTLLGYMTFLGVEKPELNAIVPTLGFNLSTWSLPYVKIVWQYVLDLYQGDRRAVAASKTNDETVEV